MAKKNAVRRPKPAAPDHGAAEFIEGLSLRLIRLVESQSRLDIKSPHPEFKPVLNSGFVVSEPEKAENIVLANVRLDIDARSEKDQSSMSLSVVIQCVYACKSRPTGSEQSSVLGHFATIAAWPYIREFVNSMTCRMTLPPLILPQILVNPGGGITMGASVETSAKPAK